jgi:hypothetical protein
MLARLLIGLLSVLVLAWVGVLLRDHRVSEAASPLLYQSRLSGAEFDRNLAKLEDAELLNPDSSLELARATYLLLRDRRAKAAEAAERLLEREPENVTAWGLLLDASRGSDPERAAQARAEIRRLNPLGGL